MNTDHDTIVAPATAAGGAIAVIRISGGEAFAVCDRIFRGRRLLAEADGYTVHYGTIAEGDRVIDDVLAAVFRAPHSYTGENCGRNLVPRLLLHRLGNPPAADCRGRTHGPAGRIHHPRLPGRETRPLAGRGRGRHDRLVVTRRARAGLERRCAADTPKSSNRLREKLLEPHLRCWNWNSTSRRRMWSSPTVRATARDDAAHRCGDRRACAVRSHSGNAIREGVAVAIAGAPNVGKSTLLNRLLNEERAMVSEIAGTTRDVIEERANIGGVLFRFLDTAGIRPTDDRLEQMGIQRTMSSIERARIVIHMVDASTLDGSGSRPGFSAPCRAETPDRRQQDRQGSGRMAASRRRCRHFGQTWRGYRRPVRRPAGVRRHRSALPRRSGRLEQPPLRSAFGGPRSPR